MRGKSRFRKATAGLTLALALAAGAIGIGGPEAVEIAAGNSDPLPPSCVVARASVWCPNGPILHFGIRPSM